MQGGISIKYKDIEHEITGNSAFKLDTKGVYMEDDITISTNIEPELGEKTITENGTYYASEDNLDGYDEVNVNIPKVIESKNIIQNGIYEAPEGVDGYSPVTVNVPNTYDQSEIGSVVTDTTTLTPQTAITFTSDGHYDTTLNNEVTVNTSGDATLSDGSQMLAPYTAYARGNKITGTMQKYVGEILTMPAVIAIVQNPTKMEYEDGEDIDLTGMILKGFYKNGDAWEGNAEYPGGVIALSELTVEPSVASFSDPNLHEKNGVTALKIICDDPLHSTNPMPYNGYKNHTAFGDYISSNQVHFYHFYYFATPATVYLTRYNGRIYGITDVSTREYISVYQDGRQVYGWVYGWGASYPFTTGTVFNDSVDETASVMRLIKDSIPVSETNPFGVNFANPTKIERVQDITITWERPGDGKELTTILQIAADESEET